MKWIVIRIIRCSWITNKLGQYWIRIDPDEQPKYQQLFVHINDLTYLRDILLLFYIEIQSPLYQLLGYQIFYEVVYSIKKKNE